jgi:BlaI family transcriptional regulator, penicillinase repressor
MESDHSPTERETEILKVLWEIGEGSVRNVHDRLVDQSGLHFNTIQTQLRIMDEKGLVASRRGGRTLYYKPLYSRTQVSSRFLHKVFDGALNELVLNMLSAKKLTNRELDELEAIVAEAKKKKNKGKSS